MTSVFAAAVARSDASGPVSLVALGSLGRRERCAFSDLDLLLLHAGRSDIAGIAERCWYPVWDAGFRLDHSVRTVKECTAVASHDVRAAVGLLDARLVAGDAALCAELLDRTRRLWEDRASTFLRELGGMVGERRRRHGELAFLLEPDVKEAYGGLRDVQLLRAAVLARPGLGPVGPEVERADDLLLVVRDALHRRAGRALDQLLLQEQDAVAADLGLADAQALMGAVATAGRTIAWASDAVWWRVSRGPVRGKPRALSAGVELRSGEVLLTVPVATAEAVLRAAGHAAELGAPLGPLPPVEPPASPWPAAARQALVGLLQWGASAVPVLEALDHAQVLAQLVPEWDAVRCLPQRNPYHRWTVDRHLCEAAAEAAQLARRVRRPDLLVVAAWLHDLGKGSRGRDHTDAGTELARQVTARLGFDAADVDVITTLVRLHLTLADAATRRDIDDPATVHALVADVGSVDVLDLLEALTEADGRATGSSAWTPWKAALVAELAGRARAVLAGEDVIFEPWAPTVPAAPLVPGVSLGPTVRVVADDRPGLFADVAGALAASGLEVRAARAATVERFAVEEFDVEPAAGAWPDEGRVRARLDAAVEGTLPIEGLLADRLRSYRPRSSAPVAPVVTVSDRATGATIVDVRASDAPGLLYRLARTLAEFGLDILQVRAATLGHEVVDAFYVRGALPDDLAHALAREARRD